ncbi:hypothetical protein RFI_31951 [Reticulomyxa filosa]|uniref:Uncharacterized protein n=1 Tax=Reticulomyxa filosa TaxID=46433 RepID=X6LXK8_RETFI|nr:hypothetical protein RFI_31951 [Reticulomyxa filosa]|eukprot:ETO05445.1 hypothetical protein RFI_31951 [Reticulomyxa filosa]
MESYLQSVITILSKYERREESDMDLHCELKNVRFANFDEIKGMELSVSNFCRQKNKQMVFCVTSFCLLQKKKDIFLHFLNNVFLDNQSW